MRVRSGEEHETTVYLVRHPLESTAMRVIHFPEPRRLDLWCASNGQPEAMVAGFYLRDPYRPLGEVRIDGELVDHEPIAGPCGEVLQTSLDDESEAHLREALEAQTSAGTAA